MSRFYDEVTRVLATGERVSMASITTQKGSSPRSSGTRCAIRENGAIIGTIGGGLLEAKTREAGVAALKKNRLCYLEFNLTNNELAASGMICGGQLEVMITPWGSSELEISGRLAKMEQGYSSGVLVTRWDEGSGSTEVQFMDDGVGASVDRETEELIRKTLSRDKTTVAIGAQGGVVVERMKPERLPLIIFGGGHVGMALGVAAPRAGFDVTIVDDREEFAKRDLHPDVEGLVCASVEEFFSTLETNEKTFIVICTPGHQSDAKCAFESLKSEAGYVGMIGSRRKSRIVIEHLKESGITDERLKVLHTPTGLEIGAETPGEIAVSILAEMISIRHQRGL